jgi:PAS domain S-box-containing protein
MQEGGPNNVKTKGANRRESNSELRETLERSEERFRVFQELSLDGFAQLQCLRGAAEQIEDWEWIYANPAAERMLRRDGVPLVGRRLLQDAPGDALARELFDHCVQVMANAQPHDFELECRQAESRGWFWATAVKVGDGVAVSLKNITRRKEDEQALRKFLTNLKAIFANTFHSFAFLDREGRIQAFNEIARQQALAVFGEELQVGRSIYDFVRPAERADFNQHFARALAGETVRVERNFSSPSEPEAWFEYYYTPVNGESSSASGVLFSALPINERKQLEHRREAQREATLSISQAASVPDLIQRCVAGAWSLAKMDGGGLFRRGAAASNFVLTELVQQPLGWPVLARSVPADSPLGNVLSGPQPVYASLADWPGLLADPTASADRTVALLPLPGQPDVNACLLLATSGTKDFSAEQQADLEMLAAPAGAVLLRLHAQEHARIALEREQQLSRLKTRFISLASHEFRNPLTVTAASAEILQKHFVKLDESRRNELFELIRGSALRITAMLDEVLVIGRAESGREVFAPVPVDLAALVRGLVDEARLADRDDHKFQFDCPTPTMPSLGDARILRHILSNLLNNAALYSPPGSSIDTTLTQTDEAVLVIIRDYGRGIPPEDLKRIWEAFERGSNVKDRAGSGLGLHIAKLMADLHGATLTCESELGRGTIFVLLLPIRSVPGDRDK